MRRLFGRLATLTLVVGLVAGSGVAVAQTTEAIAETGGMQLSLTIMGVPVDIGVTLDEFGKITEVAVDDAAFDLDKEKDTKVRFVNEDDSTRVEVKAKGKKLEAKVKTTSLDDLVGPHTWSADLFGTGTATTVMFDVAKDGDGNPSIENIDVMDLPADATADIREFDVKVDDDDDDGEVKDKAEIRFEFDGYTKRLKIEVEVEDEHHDDDDDGDHSDMSAKLKIELTGKDRRQLEGSLEELVGAHMWDGLLCDGTQVAVGFTVTDGGDLTLDGVTFDGADAPDRFDAKVKDSKIEVKFEDSKARVKIQLKSDDGDYRLKVDSKTTETCKDKKKSDDDDDDHDDNHKKKKDDDDDDDDHGGSGGGDDDDDH